jgi:hypothetical protein
LLISLSLSTHVPTLESLRTLDLISVNSDIGEILLKFINLFQFWTTVTNTLYDAYRYFCFHFECKLLIFHWARNSST